jgi:glycosyltransferase involved in cell wall biosynthesis
LLTELARCFPRINFLWVGGRQEDVNIWRERLRAENIKNILLMGFVDNSRLPLYQAAADILLMPYERVISGSSGGNSSSYASPMKMFEYMASRRAIISSDLPVIREVLNPSNAVLCPPDEIAAWSDALGTLIYDEDKRLALAEQAWQDIQGYSWLERASKALQGFPSE